MYDGSAGIGIFFIRLYEATGDSRWLTEAEEAAAHIIATQVDEKWYDETLNSEVKGIIPVPGWAAGPYNGPVGEAYFLDDLYRNIMILFFVLPIYFLKYLSMMKKALTGASRKI